MTRHRSPVRNEHGIALVIALLALLVISTLSIVLMSSLNVDTKITGHGVREAQALNTAEAGIGEAIARIQAGDVPNNNNPRMVAQVFNAAAGSVPVVGVDSIAMGTAQPAGAWLPYSTSTKGPDVLTVEYKTDAAKTVIYKYDKSLAQPIQTGSGQPIFKITSSGRRGTTTRRVVSEVFVTPLTLNIKGGMATNVSVKFLGNAVVCGYNHRADTPTNTGASGRAGAGGCNEVPGSQWELASGDQIGIWSTSTVQANGGAQAFGNPGSMAENQAGFYAGPWEVFNMSQAAFFTWLGPSQAAPANPNGLVYVNGDAAFNGGTGSGFLYVNGDLTLNSTFSYRGLIYCEGDLKFNGDAWVLGAIVVKGVSQLKNNGGATLLYSYDSIQQNISKYAGAFVTLSWKEN